VATVELQKTELIDYLVALWRWRWLVVVGTLACVLVAVGVAVVTPKTYRVTATVDTGDLQEAKAKEVERLVGRIGAGTYAGKETAPMAVSASFRRPFLVDLSVDTESPGEAARALETAARVLIEDLNRLLKSQEEEELEKIRSIRAEIEKLEATRLWRERRIGALRRKLEHLEQARPESMRTTSDPGAVLLQSRLLDQILSTETALAELEREMSVEYPAARRKLEERLETLTRKKAEVRPAKLVGPPQGVLIKPRSRTIVGAGLAAGLLGSVLVALLVDYVEQARRRPRTSEGDPR
jgi:LPS O-antigen subunit length determinant protein (WzzB/FepE family)